MRYQGVLSLRELNVIDNIEMEYLYGDQSHNHALYSIFEIINKDTFPMHAYQTVISKQKLFSDPVIGNNYLNIRGLHILRIVFAYYAFVQNGIDERLISPGYIIFSDFLQEQEVKILVDEINIYPIEMNKTAINLVRLNSIDDLLLPLISRKDEKCAIDNMKNNTFIQRLQNDPDNDDMQKDMHSDIFFPALKFWYFPQAVGPDDGPFNYVSNCNYPAQLMVLHYKQSINAAKNSYEDWRGKSHHEGSLRFSEDEVKFHVDQRPEKITCKANTLVVANVFGPHFRGNPSSTTIRNAIHGSVRVDNPFEVFD